MSAISCLSLAKRKRNQLRFGQLGNAVVQQHGKDRHQAETLFETDHPVLHLEWIGTHLCTAMISNRANVPAEQREGQDVMPPGRRARAPA